MNSSFLDKVARVAHEACRVWTKCNDMPTPPSWDSLETFTKDRIRKGAKMYLDDSGVAASALHEMWVTEMLGEGWRSGPVRDLEKKTSPMLVPYDKLPLKEQVKDHIFKGVVESFREFVQ